MFQLDRAHDAHPSSLGTHHHATTSPWLVDVLWWYDVRLAAGPSLLSLVSTVGILLKLRRFAAFSGFGFGVAVLLLWPSLRVQILAHLCRDCKGCSITTS